MLKADTRQFLRHFVARYLLRQIKRLRRHLRHAPIPTDVESIHRSRVDSRRLRAALTVFDHVLPPRRTRRWRKTIRKLTRELGHVRDLDVQIAHFQQLRNEVIPPLLQRAMDRLIDELATQRQVARRTVSRSIAAFRADATIRQMRRTLKKIKRHEPARLGSAGKKQVRHWLEAQLAKPLTDMYALAPCLDEPADCIRHHRMRVAIKKVRYVLEIGQPLMRRRAGRHLKTLRRWQAMLGDLHDLDVWIEQLTGRRAKNGPADDRPDVAAVVDFLLEHHQRRHGELFEQLRADWPQTDHAAIWRDLTGRSPFPDDGQPSAQPPDPS